MLNEFEKRLARLEKRVAQRSEERNEKTSACNCRLETHYHNADCLDAILKGILRVCPVHNLRSLEPFTSTEARLPLRSGDDQFCPCPSHPQRSVLLSKHARPLDVLKRHYPKPPPDPTFNPQVDKRRVDAIVDKYSADCQAWVHKSGRQLPSRQEIVELQIERSAQKRQRARNSNDKRSGKSATIPCRNYATQQRRALN